MLRQDVRSSANVTGYTFCQLERNASDLYVDLNIYSQRITDQEIVNIRASAEDGQDAGERLHLDQMCCSF
jgi:hypothetical protein